MYCRYLHKVNATSDFDAFLIGRQDEDNRPYNSTSEKIYMEEDSSPCVCVKYSKLFQNMCKAQVPYYEGRVFASLKPSKISQGWH